MKKILLIILVVCILTVPVNATMYEDWLTSTAKIGENSGVTTYFMTSSWDENILELDMPFRPFDKQVTNQNPPDFSWKYVDNASSYNLRIAKRPDMTDIVYTKNDIIKNLVNIETPLENGGTYYWQVQYNKDNVLSQWSKARRFRITEDAVDFRVDSIDTMISKIPNGHPRIYITAENKSEILSNKYYVDTIYSDISKAMADNTIVSKDSELSELVKQGKDINSVYSKVIGLCMETAIYYQLTGDENIADYGLELLKDISQWDYLNGYSSYKSQDQVFRRTALIGAYCYDLMFEYLSKPENLSLKNDLLTMVKARSEILFNDLFVNSTIYKTPYAGHGEAAFKYLGVISIALYNDISEAETWIREILPLFINIYPNFATGEDGGNMYGTGYWRYTSVYNKLLADALDVLDMIDLYEKPASKNEVQYITYMYPKGSVGAFGDQAYEYPGFYNAQIIGDLYRKYQEPQIAWLYKEVDSNPGTGEPNSMFMFLPQRCEILPPYNLPLGHLFKDTGIAAMHSDLENEERISMFFRSSNLGAFNHSHPDQNSFVIQAYGERLAIDSGYYDSYYSDFDTNYSRKTYAHNAITYNNGIGQELKRDDSGIVRNDNEYNKSLKGNIENFVTTNYFDSVTGNAKESYKGNLDKAKRSIIYLRPYVFIVVDDLKFKNDEKTTFEFFLNGYEDVSLIDNNTAKIVSGKAELNADVIYPSVTGYYSDKFEGPDRISYTPSGSFADRQVHQRIWFQTPSVNNTKMVTTLKVNKKNETSLNISSYIYDEYIELESEDGTRVYINLTDDVVTTNDGIIFEGAAVTKKEDKILLTDGKYLKIGSEEIISANSNITMFLSNDKAYVSSEFDVNVNIGSNISNVADENFKHIPLDIKKNGIKLSKTNNSLTFSLDKGEYEFNLNKIPIAVNESDLRILNTTFSISGNTLTYAADVERTDKITETVSYTMMLGAYENDILVRVSEETFEVNKDEYRKTVTATIDISQGTESLNYKAFIWQSNLEPQMNPALYNNSTTDVEKILINGNELVGFDNGINTYDYKFDHFTNDIPDIKVITKNSAAKVEIKNINDYPQTAEIRIISEDKLNEKVIYINFDIDLELKTEILYPSVYAQSIYNATYKSAAPQEWDIAPIENLDKRFYLRKLEWHSLTPYVKFDFSDLDIDLNKIKSITLHLYMKENYAIYEGDSYTMANGEERVADSTFEKVEVAPRLVYDGNWDSVYSESIKGDNYPFYTKYPVGTIVTLNEKKVNKHCESQINKKMVMSHLEKNRELSFAICVENNPMMVVANRDPFYGNWTDITYTGTNRPYLEIIYYEE